jgi:hypothetical protein
VRAEAPSRVRYVKLSDQDAEVFEILQALAPEVQEWLRDVVRFAWSNYRDPKAEEAQPSRFPYH